MYSSIPWCLRYVIKMLVRVLMYQVDGTVPWSCQGRTVSSYIRDRSPRVEWDEARVEVGVLGLEGGSGE